MSISALIKATQLLPEVEPDSVGTPVQLAVHSLSVSCHYTIIGNAGRCTDEQYTRVQESSAHVYR